MAVEKPLTKFLITLCHSSDLMARFNSPERYEVLREWGLADHELFREGGATLEAVQAAVAAEHETEGMAAEVAWWIRIFGPPPTPDWVWGPSSDEPDEENKGGSGGGGHEALR